MLMQC